MGATPLYNCPVGHDIDTQTGNPINGGSHVMLGRHLSGTKVSAVIVAAATIGAPLGHIQALMPDAVWRDITTVALVAGENLLEAPRWPTMRIRVDNNASGNSMEAYFAENSG
jgi:hypothetical protein